MLKQSSPREFRPLKAEGFGGAGGAFVIAPNLIRRLVHFGEEKAMSLKTQIKIGCLVLLTLPWLIASAPPEVVPCDPALACFDVRLSPENLLGDFYLDGNLVVAGVNSARLMGAPDVPHQIDVKNIQDPTTPGSNDRFIYPDQTVVQQTSAGGVGRVGFSPPKTYIKGTLQYICQPKGYQLTDHVFCRPTVDGIVQPDVSAGGNTAYYLPGGPHTIHTDLVGDQAGNWSSTARDDTVTVTNGRITWLTASFLLRGLLKLVLYPAGLTADLYLDGVLIAPQSTGLNVFVTPQVAHLVEAKNVADPKANGRYKYSDVAQSAVVSTGGKRNVYLSPPKTWLTGSLSFYCYINRKSSSDDVQCLVSVDGTQLGTVPAGTRTVFSLPNGAHTVAASTTGSSAGKWAGPVSTSLTIIGGRTAYYTGRFNLRPTVVAAVPTSVPVPMATQPPVVIISGGGGTSGNFELGGQVSNFSSPDRMKYAGMMWVKRQARWSPGAVADAGAINDAHAKGFKILLSAIGTDPHVIAGGSGYDEYAAYVGELARLGADAIEVWNEMNLDREWPMGEIDPVRYTDLLRRSYIQIKAKNPNTLVISGAPAPTGAEGAFGRARVWNDNSYIAGMAAAGAANYMDCVGVHYNEGIISPTWQSGDPRDGYYTRYYSGMVKTYFNAFGGRRKLCFTELGYLSPESYGSLPGSFGWAGNTTAGQQAQWLAEATSLARSSSSVRMIIIFNVDFSGWGDDPQGGYAIIRPGGGCPACDTLRGVTGGR